MKRFDKLVDIMRDKIYDRIIIDSNVEKLLLSDSLEDRILGMTIVHGRTRDVEKTIEHIFDFLLTCDIMGLEKLHENYMDFRRMMTDDIKWFKADYDCVFE